MSDVLAGIQQVLTRHVGVRVTVGPETELLRDLELDSLMLLTLVVEVENHFKIKLEPGDERGVVSVGDLARLVRGKLDDGC